MNEAARAVHHVIERLSGRQAGEHDVGLGADIGGRTRRHAADFCEFIERTAAVADDAIAAFDQILRNWLADFADADETNGVHLIFQVAFPTIVALRTLRIIVIARSGSDEAIQFSNFWFASLRSQ